MKRRPALETKITSTSTINPVDESWPPSYETSNEDNDKNGRRTISEVIVISLFKIFLFF